MVHNKVLVAQSCLTLRPHRQQPTRLLCPWDSPCKNTGSGLSFPSPGNLPNPGIEPWSPAFQANSLSTELPGKPMVHNNTTYIFISQPTPHCSIPPLLMYTVLLLKLLFSLKFCLFLIAKSFIRPTPSSNKSYPCLLPFSHNALFIH